MPTGRTTFVMVLAATVAIGFGGCNSNSTTGTPKAPEHDHDHDHAHHGPHHGHLMEIGEEEYHAEWTHDESGKVTFYVLDGGAKKEVPIAAEDLTIDVKIGDNAPVTYKLPAVNPQEGKSATFETVDKQLLGVLETLKSPGVVATLHVTINGKSFDQRIQEHEHGH